MPEYIAVVTINNKPLMQGAPSISIIQALKTLLDTTIEVMDRKGDQYFFFDWDLTSDILGRGGGMVYNNEQLGSVGGLS